MTARDRAPALPLGLAGERVPAIGMRGQPSWLVALVLALPFLIMIVVLRGMTVALPIFHGSDELSFHYPTILRFSHELPFPDLHSYPAAQTPLYHLLMAYAGQLIGYELWPLRLLQVAISYLLALAVFALLHRRLRMNRYQALGLTLVIVLSPYVFGQSFRLGTDNLALLFSVLAFERFMKFRQSARLGPFLAASALVGLAILSRQSTAFLLAVGIACALWPGIRLSAGQRLLALGGLALAALPAAVLFLNWHSLVPVGGDPSSCGLCAAKGSANAFSTSGIEVQTMELALATLGLYGLVLFAPPALARVRHGLRLHATGRRGWRRITGPMLAAGAGLVLLAAFPATPRPQAAGYVWKIASHLAVLHGSSIIFWIFVPLGLALTYARLRRAREPWLVGVFAACFLVSAVVIHFPWQKYVDPFAVLILLITYRPTELDRNWKWIGAIALTFAFAAYAADYSSHRSVAVPASHTTAARGVVKAYTAPPWNSRSGRRSATTT